MADPTGTVVVLAGGLSHEREVSLRSGRRVATALRETGHTVLEADVNGQLLSVLADADDPLVFPVLHGGAGEDGALREVLDVLGVSYIGSTGRASHIAFDKAVATPLVAAAGFATPRQAALPQDMFRELGAHALVEALASGIGFPMMVKPAQSGSSLGCTRVESADALPAAIVTAFGYGEVAIVEEFIEGREVAVSVVDLGDGPTALPAVEIEPVSGPYDYAARYTAGQTRFSAPADLPAAVADACADLAVQAHRILGLRDVSRTDLIIRDDTPYFLEVNVAPGMTDTSLLPLAIEASGVSFEEICSSLVAAARGREESASA
ncbi:D-alanine--D-alanine ligase [Propioniciclava soli]|uniref:D-alanine--D-alanine ligase family protein n=1 Tax=Propioniciclava soli TaxID=2775081 RepID=UPI001E385EDC